MIIGPISSGPNGTFSPSAERGTLASRRVHAASQIGTLIRLFRIWAQARDMHRNPLPEMTAAIAGRDTSPELAPACHSLFQLTEACIGRQLVPSAPCANDISRDEYALLALIEAAPNAGSLVAENRLPHGLPGALCWAASAVNRAFGVPLSFAIKGDGCPFAHDGPQA